MQTAQITVKAMVFKFVTRVSRANPDDHMKFMEKDLRIFWALNANSSKMPSLPFLLPSPPFR